MRSCKELIYGLYCQGSQVHNSLIFFKAQRTMGFSILKSKESTKLPDETSENAVLLKDT